MALKTAIIGLGKRMIEDHLPAAVESENFNVLAVCDINSEKVDIISKQYQVDGFTSLDDMLGKTKFDVAIVSVPHNQYASIILKLAESKVNIIKEKPFATSTEEALRFHNIVSSNNVFLGVTLQRRFNPIFQAFHQLKKRIGKIYSIEGSYVMNIAKLDEGWRSSREMAGGGVLVDMGYHLIDLLVWYMGLPTSVTAKLSRGNRLGQNYDVEDTVNLLFDYSFGKPEEKVVGNFIISRVYPKKDERLTVLGTKGIINIQRGKIQRLNSDGDEIESLERSGGWFSAAIDQLDYFANIIKGTGHAGVYDYYEHFQHIAIIEAAYESDRKSSSCSPSDYLVDVSNLKEGEKYE